MLRKIMLGMVLVGSLMVGAQMVSAAAYDWHVYTRNSTDTGDVVTDLPLSSLQWQFVATDPATHLPHIWGTDDSLEWNTDTYTFNVGIINQSEVRDLISDLNTIRSDVNNRHLKSTVDAATTSLQSQINSMNAASTTIQKLRVQTDSSGSYTWTFPTAFASGTMPVVTATPEDATGSASTDVRITAVSTTSVTVQATRITSVLGILSLNTTPQIYVHLTAVKP